MPQLKAVLGGHSIQKITRKTGHSRSHQKKNYLLLYDLTSTILCMLLYDVIFCIIYFFLLHISVTFI